MNDSTSIQYAVLSDKDKYKSLQVDINSWRVSRRKGSITAYFDGSGRIARYTLTVEGK